ncbi:MAG TPA: hypothetical protein VGA36_09940 [Nitriliruptorales bacterium]
MRICPSCGDEFHDDVADCPECRVALVAEGEPILPPLDAVLGTFHPLVAERVVGLLRRRSLRHDVMPLEDRVEILMDRGARDRVRAELSMSWTDLMGQLPHDDLFEVLSAGAPQPGWYDPPEGAWVDRDGQVQVEGSLDELAEQDAHRIVGPSMAVIGLVLGLFGWYAGDSGALAVVGIVLVVVGLLVPR